MRRNCREPTTRTEQPNPPNPRAVILTIRLANRKDPRLLFASPARSGKDPRSDTNPTHNNTLDAEGIGGAATDKNLKGCLARPQSLRQLQGPSLEKEGILPARQKRFCIMRAEVS
jgi:hypothetical protein